MYRIELRHYSSRASKQTELTKTDYSAKPPSRYRVYSMSLADTSNTREPDHPVLQHWRPCSALGQAQLQASGATEPHRHGKLTPRPFNLVGNQASLGDESQLSDVSQDRLSAPFLYGFHDPRFTRCDNSDIGEVSNVDNSIPYDSVRNNFALDLGQTHLFRAIKSGMFGQPSRGT